MNKKTFKFARMLSILGNYEAGGLGWLKFHIPFNYIFFQTFSAPHTLDLSCPISL